MKRKDRKIVKLTPVRLRYLEVGKGPVYLRVDSDKPKTNKTLASLDLIAERIKKYEAGNATNSQR